ncbi:MAG: hypothetical protein ABIZ81_03565 [Opitutaceae bacterium]
MKPPLSDAQPGKDRIRARGVAGNLVCIAAGQPAVVLLSNDVRAEAGFADLVRFILGETGVPYEWEYGEQAGKS